MHGNHTNQLNHLRGWFLYLLIVLMLFDQQLLGFGIGNTDYLCGSLILSLLVG